MTVSRTIVVRVDRVLGILPTEFLISSMREAESKVREFPGQPDPADILFDSLFGKIILFGIKFKIFNYLLNKVLSNVRISPA